MSRIPSQPSLFDTESDYKPTVADALAQASPKNPKHASFQRLVRQIQKLRLEITEWQDFQQVYDQRVVQELTPLFDALREKSI